MKVEEMVSYFPSYWEQMDLKRDNFKMVRLFPESAEFQEVMAQVQGNYYLEIEDIFRLQNPYSFIKFKLKEFECCQRGSYDIKTLYHDTSQKNVESIANYNFDWRHGTRCMFGPGVYFSCSPKLANKHSNKRNGRYRSMILTHVLMQNVQYIQGEVILPDMGYDTVLCHGGTTYVKYFDSEFYPEYFINYSNAKVHT